MLVQEDAMKVGEKYWNHHFRVMVSKLRTWVRWGYAKDGDKAKPTHVEPKMTNIRVDGHALSFPFKLGEGFESDGVKYRCEVADEVTSWGWKTYSPESPNANGMWELAGSMEECLEAAMEDFKSQGLIPEGFTVVDEAGDWEELPLTAEWQEFAKEAFAAVDSWQHGKGWPKGWKRNVNDA
jgi:hypothetical protein